MVVSPHHLDATMVQGRTHRMTSVFGRLAPGATPRQAQVELDAIMARLQREHPDAYDPGAGYRVTASPLRDALTERARRSVLLLTATAAGRVEIDPAELETAVFAQLGDTAPATDEGYDAKADGIARAEKHKAAKMDTSLAWR